MELFNLVGKIIIDGKEAAEKIITDIDKNSREAAKAMGILEDSSEQAGKGIQQAGEEMEQAAQKTEKASQKISESGKASEEAGKKITQFWKNLSEGAKNLEKPFETIGKGVKSAGDTIGKYISLPLAAAGTAAVKVGMDFEAQMSRVSAISGATGKDLQDLTDMAKKLGADTSFSAGQAAEGMENLGSAGFNAKEIMAAMPGMLDLAASSGEDLANSAEIAASTLRGFGLAADQAGHVADVLAKNAADTNAAVADTGEAMKYVAPVAENAGWALESVVAAIGEMANAGIKGSQSGTTLRGVISQLAKPSKEASDLMKEMGFNAYDNQGKMLSLSQIISNLQKSTEGMTKQQQDYALTTIFGTEALSGMEVLIKQGSGTLDQMTQSLKNSDGAAKAMAQTILNNGKGNIEQLMGSLETLGITVEEKVSPKINNLVVGLNNLVNKYGEMTPAQQDLVLNMGLVAIATGPVLSGIGNLFIKGSELTKVFSSMSGAIAGAGGLGPALGALATNPITLTIVGIAGITTAGIALYNHLQQSAIPAVKLFGDETSVSTQKAVQGYIDLSNKATSELMTLKFNGIQISKDTADGIVAIYADMATQIKQGLDKHYQDSLQDMSNFFAQSSALTESEEKKILDNMQQHNENEKKSVDDGLRQIKAIQEQAAQEHRTLTDQEYSEISKIQEQMKETAVRSLSDTEIESKAILERMKQQAGNLTAQQAAEVVQNSAEQRDKAIKAAEDQCNKTIAEIIRERDESGTISAEQAQALIGDAERQKNETVRHATEMHEQVVAQAKLQAQEHINEVDWETGQILTLWDKIGQKLNQLKNAFGDVFTGGDVTKYKLPDLFKKTTTSTNNANVGDFKELDHFASGTDNAPGGMAIVGEEGPELIDLPSGSKVYTTDETKEMLAASSSGSGNNLSSQKSAMQEFSSMVDQYVSNVMSRARSAIDVATNSLEKWRIENNVSADSSDYAAAKLENQKVQQAALEQQIGTVQDAISKLTEKYGANSDEVDKYKSQLSDLQLQQAKLNQEMNPSILEQVGNAFKSLQENGSLALDVLKSRLDVWMATQGQTATETEKLDKQAELLNQQYVEQTKVVDGMKAAYEQMVQQYGAAYSESEKLELQLNKEMVAQAQLSQQIAETNKIREEKATSFDDEGYAKSQKFGQLMIEGKALKQFGYTDQQIYDWASKLAGLAEGGTIRKSGAVMVGEEGPEILDLPQGATVTPLNKNGGITLKQTNYFNVQGTTDATRKLMSGLRQAGLLWNR